MTNANPINENEANVGHRQLLQSQLEQALTTWRWQFGLLIQIFTVLAVVHISFLGYGFSKRYAGIILLGTLFPLVFFVLLRIASRLTVPTIYTAIALEDEWAKASVDCLMTTNIGVILSEDHIRTFTDVRSESDLAKRLSSLRDMTIPIFGKYTRRIEYLLVLNAMGQIALAIILVLFLQWSLFGRYSPNSLTMGNGRVPNTEDCRAGINDDCNGS